MWTYLKFDEFGERTEDSPQLPEAQTVYLGFDVCRMALVLGYTESGGYHSMLNPNVCDDCKIVAFAPLDEETQPDMETIFANGPWREVKGYSNCKPMPTRLLKNSRMNEPKLKDLHWYLVSYEGLGCTYRAPAMYKKNVDAFYSYQLAGIPARQLEVIREIDT